MTTPPCERSPHMTLSLQEILIVGSAVEQAKFSELTMDMFRWEKNSRKIVGENREKKTFNLSLRMLQTLEREPQESFVGLSSGGHPLGLGSVPHGGPHGNYIIITIVFINFL